MRLSIGMIAVALLLAHASPALTQAAEGEAAAAFGALPLVQAASLSPDGERIVYVSRSGRNATMARVMDARAGAPSEVVMIADGDPEVIRWCRWKTAQRILCFLSADTLVDRRIETLTRTLAVDADGSDRRIIGEVSADHQYGSGVIDWLVDDPDHVLMLLSDNGVGRVNVHDGRIDRIERSTEGANGYMTDGNGVLRVRMSMGVTDDGVLGSRVRYQYRLRSGGTWRSLGEYRIDDESGFYPVAIDAAGDRAVGFERRDGRQALVAVALDDSGRNELLLERPDVDVDGIVLLGQRRIPVGASYATDRRHVAYFDSTLERMTASLSRALGGKSVSIVDTSADRGHYLIWAGSDVDAGAYYRFTPASRELVALLIDRHEVAGTTMAPMRAVTYPASDGTSVPGYLTLPPGRSDARGLPAIVLPHGGPSARDEWGFDWLVQYLAGQGYAVLQPNYRGSAGYGEGWYQRNGFQSWRAAIGDVADAGRWLVTSEGVDARRLSILGWSYGGYAALQTSAMNPDLFKSVVAIAPVTDLVQLRSELASSAGARNQRDFIGSGPHLREGSPARHADAIAVPVLMFHGTMDGNVDVRQSRTMQRALREAGKPVELIEYPGLDHQIESAEARTDMLRRIGAFLPR